MKRREFLSAMGAIGAGAFAAPAFAQTAGQPQNWADIEKQAATEGAAKPLSLTPALRAGMAGHARAARARLLEQGAALARARVEAIVSNKNRGAYERAARLWSAVHDAHVLAGRADDGARLLAELRDRLSRHYRFRERLDTAVRGSAAALARWRSPHSESG